MPKKFKFKLKQVDLENKYKVKILSDRKLPEENQYWHRVAKVLKLAELNKNTLHAKIAVEAVRKAQEVYDSWEQDEDGQDEIYGSGGICDDIADALCEVINSKTDLECLVDYNETDTHTSVYAYDEEKQKVFHVDIPPAVYEVGYGYNWSKKPGVTFRPTDLVVEDLSSEWSSFKENILDY